MRKLAALGLVLLFLFGCEVRSIRKGDYPKDKDWWKYTHYFTNQPARLIFKSSLDISKEHFSGLLIVKKTNEGEYRSIFTTETGFKVFDFTIYDESYTLNYGVGPIAKKFIADRLAYTIQVMLLRGFSSGYRVYSGCQSYKMGKYVYELYHEVKEDMLIPSVLRIKKQILFKNGKPKAEAFFYQGEESELPDSSSVTHIGFPLKASFRLLKP